MVRAYAAPALEDVALWHERDISHSSAERMIAPDATTTLAFMLERATSLVDGLVVYPENLRKNLERTDGLFFSEAILLRLVDKGLARQDAYVIVQKSAMKAIAGHGTFRQNLEGDADIARHLSAGDIAEAFNLEHALRHAEEIVSRARR
jgi:adenylosuccinate lyase